MKIQIEDYFGNDVLRIDYSQNMSRATENTINIISEISEVCGYNVADVEDGYVRVQQVECVDNCNTNKNELIHLVTKFNTQFL